MLVWVNSHQPLVRIAGSLMNKITIKQMRCHIFKAPRKQLIVRVLYLFLAKLSPAQIDRVVSLSDVKIHNWRRVVRKVLFMNRFRLIIEAVTEPDINDVGVD